MTEHLAFDRLSDYLAGLLHRSASEDVEAHFFACPACATESERWFAIAAALTKWRAAVLSRDDTRRLRGKAVSRSST